MDRGWVKPNGLRQPQRWTSHDPSCCLQLRHPCAPCTHCLSVMSAGHSPTGNRAAISLVEHVKPAPPPSRGPVPTHLCIWITRNHHSQASQSGEITTQGFSWNKPWPISDVHAKKERIKKEFCFLRVLCLKSDFLSGWCYPVLSELLWVIS